ncbi:MAG TPA: hypothetical protein PL163_23905 [Leptospiraceae bacterium]|nr:hypothetical protein [Leptospiraceae bacterium]HMY69709.1 hypothetical protein [Leptospiraceae bacterium]HNF26307.1 hypothetical protein [Leptospiraceae bacterium]HNM06450.1 hypothetical protein [Leptospiraceae bacterium]
MKTVPAIKKKDSIRAGGAELFIQSYLMLEYGIPVSAAPRNMPDFDLIAHNWETGNNCFIQVKFRKAKSNDGVRISNFNFDFLAVVCGNLGETGDNADQRKDGDETKIEVFIFPKSFVEKKFGNNSTFNFNKFKKDGFLENYSSIYNFLY